MSVDSADKLAGQVSLVTGVSRRAGIGFAIVCRLLSDGGSVFYQSWSPYDAEQSWGADPAGATGVLAALGAREDRVGHAEIDLGDAANAEKLMSSAVDTFGHVDLLIVNHARQLGTVALVDDRRRTGPVVGRQRGALRCCSCKRSLPSTTTIEGAVGLFFSPLGSIENP